MPHNEWDQQGGGLWVGGKKKIKQTLSNAVLEDWCVCACFIICCELWGYVPIKKERRKKGLNLIYGKNVRNSWEIE